MLIKNQSRRNFFKIGSSFFLTALAANTSIYTVGLAFKNLDGSLVAGAKSCGPTPSAGCTASQMICGSIVCNTTTGRWIDNRTCEPRSSACR